MENQKNSQKLPLHATVMAQSLQGNEHEHRVFQAKHRLLQCVGVCFSSIVAFCFILSLLCTGARVRKSSIQWKSSIYPLRSIAVSFFSIGAFWHIPAPFLGIFCDSRLAKPRACHCQICPSRAPWQRLLTWPLPWHQTFWD